MTFDPSDYPFEVDPEAAKLLEGQDMDELRPGDLVPAVPHLTRAEAAKLLADLGDRITDGRRAVSQRAGLIQRLHKEGWIQSDIAATANMSQPAVSKALKTTPGRQALEENHSAPYLVGRLIGLAVHLSDRRKNLRCERAAWKLAEGNIQPLPSVIGQLRALLARDLALPGIPEAYRAAMADITSGLDDVAESPALLPWPMADRSSMILAQHHQSKWLTDELAAARKKSAS